MAIASDFTLDYSAKTITHSANSNIYTVQEMYSWLMDLFDDAAQMDDDIPMAAQTPVEFSMENDWALAANCYPFLKGGAVNDKTNDDLWANVYTLGTIVSGAQIYIIQDSVEITPTWGTDHIDILVKVKASGSPIAAGKLLLMVRDTGSSFDHFEIDVSAGGRNAVPLATAADLNNATADATVATYNDITITFGSVNKDLANGNGSQPYDVVIDCKTRTLAQVYEYLKYVCRHNSASTLNGDAGEEYLSADGGYVDVKAAPFGTFAGGTFFGAQGVWIENMDANDAKAFQLIDGDGDTQSPPNTIAIKVTSVEVGSNVYVFELDGVGGSIVSSIIGEVAAATTVQTTQIYTADIPVLIRVRKYGLLPFEVPSTITNTGLSVAAIKTTDTIVS